MESQKHYLVIGKGEAFMSFVKILAKDKLDLSLTQGEGAYSLHLGESGRRNEKVIPAAFTEFYRNQATLTIYDSVYIFPDELIEGYDFLTLFQQLGTCRIFVITGRARYATIYKRLGAHHVIISKPQNHGYNWLTQHIIG